MRIATAGIAIPCYPVQFRRTAGSRLIRIWLIRIHSSFESIAGKVKQSHAKKQQNLPELKNFVFDFLCSEEARPTCSSFPRCRVLSGVAHAHKKWFDHNKGQSPKFATKCPSMYFKHFAEYISIHTGRDARSEAN